MLIFLDLFAYHTHSSKMPELPKVHDRRATRHVHDYTGNVTTRNSVALACKQKVAVGPQQ